MINMILLNQWKMDSGECPIFGGQLFIVHFPFSILPAKFLSVWSEKAHGHALSHFLQALGELIDELELGAEGQG